jgi:predicted permease
LNGADGNGEQNEQQSLLLQQKSEATVASRYDTESIWETATNIFNRCFQPPVQGAILGILCAVTPARGIFVDLVDRDSDAPLQWLFDGLYAVGQTAVPINMMILGCNLSSSLKQTKTFGPESGMLSTITMWGIVFGKMVLMPVVGILSGYVLKNYVWNIPEDIDGAFYLVLMIVFLTPTANNVMVMVELSGSGAKEGIARVIALQYAVAPVILSVTMTIAIGVASDWS